MAALSLAARAAFAAKPSTASSVATASQSPPELDIFKAFVIGDRSFNVNILWVDDQPLFRANDIGVIIGITNIRTSIQSFDRDDKVVRSMYSLGGSQETTFLSEGGLYKLLMRSRKREAEPFQKWVISVITSIRKTGKYEIQRTLESTVEHYQQVAASAYHEGLTEAYGAKRYVVYFGRIRKGPDNKWFIKVGSTENLSDRVPSLKKEFGDMCIFAVFECCMYRQFEDKLQTHPAIRQHVYTEPIHAGRRSYKEVFLMTEEAVDYALRLAKKHLHKYQDKATVEQLIELKRLQRENAAASDAPAPAVNTQRADPKGTIVGLPAALTCSPGATVPPSPLQQSPESTTRSPTLSEDPAVEPAPPPAAEELPPPVEEPPVFVYKGSKATHVQRLANRLARAASGDKPLKGRPPRGQAASVILPPAPPPKQRAGDLPPPGSRAASKMSDPDDEVLLGKVRGFVADKCERGIDEPPNPSKKVSFFRTRKSVLWEAFKDHSKTSCSYSRFIRAITEAAPGTVLMHRPIHGPRRGKLGTYTTSLPHFVNIRLKDPPETQIHPLVRGFLADCCEYDATSTVPTTKISVMFAAFRKYVDADWAPFPFNQEMLQRDYTLGKCSTGERAWIGLRLRS